MMYNILYIKLGVNEDGLRVQEGLAAPSESWKNRENVTPHSKNVAPTLSRFQLKKGQCIYHVNPSQ